jgi:leucyl-tRNA synthetase
MNDYDHRKIERRWQRKWAEAGIYKPDLKKAKRPFYNLMMFPYPSAEGLHVGNMYAFTGADVYGRFQRMQGKDVFEPIGLDGFGIHSENYAISIGKHPAEQAKVSEKRFYKQLTEIGNGFSWDNRLETYDSDYYRWTQWLFVQMFKHGLAYRKKASVNWCPSCRTVLADEQVEGGVCERCKTATERREAEQWFFKITEYADRLLENIDKIDWPEKIKTAQRNWIGRSEGAEIDWDLGKGCKITTFTTRLDTIFGATFLVLSPEYAMEASFLQGKEVYNYVIKALGKTEQERKLSEKTKEGVRLHITAKHPLTDERVPIWIAEFVLGDYGTGAVMGVPGHDQRDHDFARQHNIPIKKVIDVEGKSVGKEAVEEYGILVNSEVYSGMSSQQAKKAILRDLENRNSGRKSISYHLRDWLISRQRYWGPPIPMLKCKKCGWQPVPEKELPVTLPHVEEYKPTGDGRSPLEKAPEFWLYTKCPECGEKAERETDVSDTFLDSAWYFLAYPNLRTKEWKSQKAPFNNKITKRWLPVDAYIGGAEHAVLHLLYSRFVTMALHDWGHLDFEEPFPFLYSHGLIIREGAKMSKSRGNIVVPDEYIKKYGSDTLRTYLMFLGRYDRGGDFRDAGIAGMNKFLKRVWRIFQENSKLKTKTERKTGEALLGTLQRTIRKVTEDIKKFRYNTAIAALMEFVNEWESGIRNQELGLSYEDERKFLKLLAPFAPHMTEELFQILLKSKVKSQKSEVFNSIHVQPWPAYDEKLVQLKEIEIPVQVNGKLRGTVRVSSNKADDKELVVREAKKNERVLKYIKGKKIRKTIWVQGRLVNFVVSSES